VITDTATHARLRVDGQLVAVQSVGLACCAVEVADGMASIVQVAGADPVRAHVLVVGGTIAMGLVDQLRSMWRALPSPRAVVSYGACTISGGPYWDSYSVVRGLPPDMAPVIAVAGCPPRPDVLVEAIVQAARLVLPSDAPGGDT